jgi:hypothetical protein
MVKLQAVKDEDLNIIMDRWRLQPDQRDYLIGRLNYIIYGVCTSLFDEAGVLTKRKKALKETTQKTLTKLLNSYDEQYPYGSFEEPGYDSSGEDNGGTYLREWNWGADDDTSEVIDLLRRAKEIIDRYVPKNKRAKGNRKNETLKLFTLDLYKLYNELTGCTYHSKQIAQGTRINTPFTEVLLLLYKRYGDENYIMQSENSFNKSVENYLKEGSKQK